MSTNDGTENASQLQESIISEKTLVNEQSVSQSVLDRVSLTTSIVSRKEPKDLANLRNLLKFPPLPVRAISASQQERTKCVALLEGLLFEEKCQKFESLVYKEVVEGVGRLLRGVYKRRVEKAPAEKIVELKNSLQTMYSKNVEQCVASFRDQLCSLLTIDMESEADSAQSAADEEVLRRFLEDLGRVGVQQEQVGEMRARNAALSLLLEEVELELQAAQRLEEMMDNTLKGLSVPDEREMTGAARALQQCGQIAAYVDKCRR